MIIGLDLGTSAVKAIAVRGLEIVAASSAALTVMSPALGWSEQQPEAWWDAVGAALQALSKQIDLSTVTGIGLSGQMHGLVLLNRDGGVIRPAILWNDSRAATACDTFNARCPEIGYLAGIAPLPGLTAPKMIWLKEHEPRAYDQIAQILLPKDYIGFRLHGGFVGDVSDAAGTLWLDQQKRRWSGTLCAASDTRQDWLPELGFGHEQVGEVTEKAARETGLPVGCPVFAGGGDAATGAVSLGATEPGAAFLSLGTSGQLFLAGDSYRPNPDQYVHAFAHTVPDRWYQMAAMLNGARPVAWLADVLGCTPADVGALAETAALDRVPLFLPYLTGERSPHGDPHIRAGFFGLEDATGRAEMCRAVLEAIAFCFADAAESFGESLNGVSQLFAIGGGAKSDVLLQLIATSTGKRLARAAGADHGPALGGARLAQAGLGELSLSDLATAPDIAATFEPLEDQPGFHERLTRYRALYRALAPLAHAD